MPQRIRQHLLPDAQEILLPFGGQFPALALHLHLPAECEETLARGAIHSVLRQTHPRWTLYVTAAGEAPQLSEDSRVHALPGLTASRSAGIARALAITGAPHLVPLAYGSTLTPGALLAYAQAIAAVPEGPASLCYADQDERGPRGERRNPWFKPAWDEALFLAQHYLSAACAIPVAAARQVPLDPDVPDEIAVYALLLGLLLGRRVPRAEHVRYVATTTPADTWCADHTARAQAVAAVVGESGARVAPGPFGTLAIRRPLPEALPTVSVIVPTRDRLDLLAACVEGVLHATDYPALELIIADNASAQAETLAYLQACARDARVKVLRWPHPYNYSAINNFAVAEASGAYVCLLNNDTEVIDPSWLRALMAHAVRPGIGAVGARLLYPDRSIQHAGVVVGLGNAAGHAHRGLGEGDPGYFAQALVARAATAVTAACLVVAKSKFDAVGGLDAEAFAIAYNDVDLCLKLGAAGWRNIYEPQAVLIHHEGKSRGLDFAPEHVARYRRELAVLQERWGTVGYHDPTHHPALDPASETYRLML